MRVIKPALLIALLLACPKKEERKHPPGDAEVQGTLPAGDAETQAAISQQPKTDCPDEPGWLAAAPCKGAERIYAVGVFVGQSKLARQTASERARVELAKLGMGEPNEDGSVVLRDSEILDSFDCKQTTYVLASVRSSGSADPDTASCDDALMQPSETTNGCPAWTRRGAWLEGDTIMAVGFVEGIKNKALASQTARSRATAEATKLRAVTIRVDGEGSTIRAGGPAPGLPTAVEMSECKGRTFARVTLQAP
jgi:hypothetical protein